LGRKCSDFTTSFYCIWVFLPDLVVLGGSGGGGTVKKIMARGSVSFSLIEKVSFDC